MSRQLAFSSTISVMIMAAFVLSPPTTAASVLTLRVSSAQVGTANGR
jgi:hypothetical protein